MAVHCRHSSERTEISDHQNLCCDLRSRTDARSVLAPTTCHSSKRARMLHSYATPTAAPGGNNGRQHLAHPPSRSHRHRPPCSRLSKSCTCSRRWGRWRSWRWRGTAAVTGESEGPSERKVNTASLAVQGRAAGRWRAGWDRRSWLPPASLKKQAAAARPTAQYPVRSPR